MSYLPFGASTYFLGSSIGSTDTSILLSSFTEPVTGIPYTMALINSTIVFATIAPKTTSSEFISFTGITQNVNGTALLTGVTRGLAKKYPFTSSAAYQQAHAGQSTFIISDAPQVFNEYASLINNQTFTGQITFTLPPIGINPGGQPNASTTVSGIVQEATLAQTLARTVAGSSGADLYVNPGTLPSTLTSDYAADTGSANAYAIAPTPAITAYVTGQVFSFKASNANTTTSTLAVNNLATKNITKLFNSNLAANDILANQIVYVQYDGTQFQMLNNVGNAPQLLASLSTDTTMGGTAPSSTLYPSQSAVNTFNLLKAFFSTDFETSARFSNIANSGTNTFGTNGVQLDTTVTTTRSAGITWAINPAGAGDTFAGNPVFTASLAFAAIGTTGSTFCGIGNPTSAGSGHTYTAKQAGFKITISGSVATLFATQGDGTTEAASSALTTLAISDWLDVVLQVISGSSVNYWWRKNGGAWSAATNLSTHVPASNASSCQFSISNNSTATDNVMTVSCATYQRN